MLRVSLDFAKSDVLSQRDRITPRSEGHDSYRLTSPPNRDEIDGGAWSRPFDVTVRNQDDPSRFRHPSREAIREGTSGIQVARTIIWRVLLDGAVELSCRVGQRDHHRGPDSSSDDQNPPCDRGSSRCVFEQLDRSLHSRAVVMASVHASPSIEDDDGRAAEPLVELRISRKDHEQERDEQGEQQRPERDARRKHPRGLGLLGCLEPEIDIRYRLWSGSGFEQIENQDRRGTSRADSDNDQQGHSDESHATDTVGAKTVRKRS